MARVNICGFETGDDSECSAVTTSGTGAITFQTATARTGYALRCNCPAGSDIAAVELRGVAADGIAALSNAVTSYTRFYFLFVTVPASASEEILSVYDTASAAKFQLRIDSNKNLSAWNGATQLGSTGTTVLNASQWYCIEVRVGSGVTALWEIRINGASEITATSTLGSSLNTGKWRFGKDANRNSNAVDFYYDDITIDDAAYPGPGSIVRLDPAADVAKTNWLNQAASSTNLFQSVDDLASQAGHDTDSTYIVTSTSGVVTYTASFPALSTRQIIGTINEIKFIAFGRDTGTTLTWRISVRPASNAATTTALDGSNTYAMRAILYKTSGGTDALTIANVNTCQASFVHVQANARELRCTAMSLMLDLPGAGGQSLNIRQAMNRAASW